MVTDFIYFILDNNLDIQSTLLDNVINRYTYKYTLVIYY